MGNKVYFKIGFVLIQIMLYLKCEMLNGGKFMNQALYRKYRPLFFKDVVGQKSVVKILQNSILNNRIGHAYMFFGPRGTGKTSLAKIFARSINCSDLNNGEVCGKCAECKGMMENCVDIIEIDAASNNGVDEIRELKSKVNLVPSSLKYKVYIIDEVHMLSIGAFNALLKTLEEPPEHIVFILATTDPQKVPDTIKSRCQCFNFKRISDNEIVQKLLEICKKESISISTDILTDIAVSSNGGLRDSLSMLDMLYSSCGKNISLDDYIDINNLVTTEEISKLLDEIACGNIDSLLEHLQRFNMDGKNLVQICEMLLRYIRDIVVDFYRSSKQSNLDISLLESLAFLLNDKLYDIKKASNPSIYIEIVLLNFISTIVSSDKIISSKIEIEQKFDSNRGSFLESEDSDVQLSKQISKNDVSGFSNKSKEVLEKEDSYDKIESDFLNQYREIMKIRVDNTLSKANKSLLLQVKDKFSKLSEYVFDQNIGYLVCALMDGTVRVVSDENIVMSLEYDSMIDANLKNMELLKSSLYKITGLTQNLAFITDSVWNLKKQEYIYKLQNGENYQYIAEPSLPKLETKKKSDPLISHAIELFGDIVEEE